MKNLRLILGDQLSHTISSLEDIDRKQDIVMLCEVYTETKYVKHHKKKIAFILSAMRNFADELRAKKINVRYIKFDDPNNTGNFSDEIARAIEQTQCKKIIVTEPGEYRLLEIFSQWEMKFNVPVEIRTDKRFLCSKNDFKKWAENKKQLRMEFFYREMRKKYNILMDNLKPLGGKWNFDKENRKTLKNKVDIPKRIVHQQSKHIKEVLALVKNKFSDHIGMLEPFNFAVTRKQALLELENFIKHFLPFFGDYQDVMLENEPYLYHSLLSAYVNCGLLLPLEVCLAVEDAYLRKKVKLNAAEGFIRQILGWREFIRGVYWLYIPEYAEHNFLQANKPLPEFYWNAETDLHCLSTAITHTINYAYSHHIQRLMLTGNFALLAGLKPKEVCEWYLIVYADAYEWVELPNTLGMALFADGGIVASKPYIGSGKYINRMSNYCKSCKYNPQITVGVNACPFNFLFWNFIAKHENILAHNQRMTYVLANWKKMNHTQKKRIVEKSEDFLKKLK